MGGNKDKIEKLLKNYRSLRSSVQIKLNKDYPNYSLNSVSFIKTSGKTNKIVSQVEDYVVDKYSLEDAILKKIQVIQIIKAAYDSLAKKEKKIIIDLYFEEEGINKIATDMNLSERTIIRRRKAILRKLKNVGILEAWAIWEKVR